MQSILKSWLKLKSNLNNLNFLFLNFYIFLLSIFFEKKYNYQKIDKTCCINSRKNEWYVDDDNLGIIRIYYFL